MRIEVADFAAMVELAMPGRAAHLRPAVEKELLHYDILFCLERFGALQDLVLQGGTALRLCYGAGRLSEDLDFAGGADFSGRKFATVKQCIEEYLGARYGLEVAVREPGPPGRAGAEPDVRVDRWRIAVATAPERRDLPKQRIRIEVASVPAHTRRLEPMRVHYDVLPDGYEDTLIRVEAPEEIMADKLVSLTVAQKSPRHRDIWDLAWLRRRQVELRADLVRAKLRDYRIKGFASQLRRRIDSVEDMVRSRAFHAEMRRFLPQDAVERTLGREEFVVHLGQTVRALLEELGAEAGESGD